MHRRLSRKDMCGPGLLGEVGARVGRKMGACFADSQLTVCGSKPALGPSRFWAARLVLAIWALAGPGCGEESLQRVPSLISAEPSALEFPDGCLGEVSTGYVLIRNIGGTRVQLVSARVEPEGVFTAGQLPAQRLAPGGEARLAVAFAPVQAGGRREEARLILETDDGFVLVVPLGGRTGLQQLIPFPAEIAFGVVEEGRPQTRVLELRNEGGSPLTVNEVVWTSTSVDLKPAEGGFRGGVIAPKTMASLSLVYDPVDLGKDGGVIDVFSDDPDTPRLQVAVSAEANLQPQVELLACKQPSGEGCLQAEGQTVLTVGLDETVILDGRRAQDPEGGDLRYRWTVVERPSESIAAVFPGPDEAVGDLLVDQFGPYTVQVVVRDPRGLESEPSQIQLRPRDLDLRLSWDLATDVDLHLVRPGGQVGDYGNGVPGRSDGSDCSTFNRSPRWGDIADRDDDPRLDRDAVTTPGPEFLGLDRPEPGAYAVYAHYCDSRDTRRSTTARIEVLARGDVVAELGPVRLEPGQLWKAAELVWDEQRERFMVDRGAAIDRTLRPDICRTD